MVEVGHRALRPEQGPLCIEVGVLSSVDRFKRNGTKKVAQSKE